MRFRPDDGYHVRQRRGDGHPGHGQVSDRRPVPLSAENRERDPQLPVHGGQQRRKGIVVQEEELKHRLESGQLLPEQ